VLHINTKSYSLTIYADLHHLLVFLALAVFFFFKSLPLQFTPPRSGRDFSWNEPTFACRDFHVIRPYFGQFLGRETICTHCYSQWGVSSPCLDLSQNVAAAILCSSSRREYALHSTSSFNYKYKMWKQCHLVTFSPTALLDWDYLKLWKVPVPYTCNSAVQDSIANIRHSSLFLEKSWKMLQQRTWVNFAFALPQRFPCSTSFRALTIYNPRLSAEPWGRKVHNKKNVGCVYVHESDFVENLETYKTEKTVCNGLSFFLRIFSISKSARLVTLFINLYTNGLERWQQWSGHR